MSELEGEIGARRCLVWLAGKRAGKEDREKCTKRKEKQVETRSGDTRGIASVVLFRSTPFSGSCRGAWSSLLVARCSIYSLGLAWPSGSSPCMSGWKWALQVEGDTNMLQRRRWWFLARPSRKAWQCISGHSSQSVAWNADEERLCASGTTHTARYTCQSPA
ncbi:hypothetical protein GQ54DRAFT_79569 [Martensiomyces pterosporus]|nr:hypothetical protein GQ54DRAFT_79569 [Martensiomyces pterosporus]